MVGARYVLGPEVALGSQDVLALFLAQLAGYRLHLIDLAQRQVAADGQGLLVVVLELIVVDVAVVSGSHDNAVVLTGCLYAALEAAPAHDGGVLGQAAFQNLVPSDELASF